MMSSCGMENRTELSMQQQPFPGRIIMSEDSKDNTEERKNTRKTSMKDDWGSSLSKKHKSLFNKQDFDIFCDKEQGETFIFHGPELACTIDYLEYNPENQRVMVYTTDGQKLDLGARIQWLIRPYFTQSRTVLMVRTENGKAIGGFEVPLKIKEPVEEKTLN